MFENNVHQRFWGCSKIILAPEVWWRCGGKRWRPGGGIGQLCKLAISWFVSQFGISYQACPLPLLAIVGQYQSIGLLDAQPTTWMLNWQTSPVHHCRPKQPVKPKGKTPISGELVLVSDCPQKVFHFQDVLTEGQISIDMTAKTNKKFYNI